MPTNDFLPFATAGGANVLSQAAYAAEAARSAGVAAGTAKSSLANKSWRQSALMAAALGQFINDYGLLDALDDGVAANLELAFARSIQANKYAYVVATGTANAWTVAPTPALAAYTAGRVLWIKAPATNTATTVTANVSALGTRPVKKADGTDPAVGDLVSGRLYPTIDDGTNICVASSLPSDVASSLALNGQCQLTLVGGNLQLARKNGSQIIVDGQPRTLPATPITLASTGVGNSSSRFIYAYSNAGVPALEYSSTARATGADGTQIKNADPTRALVGIARSTAAGIWEDSASKRLVRSWFNPQATPLWNRFTANRSTAALEASKVELNSEIRCEFVCFSDDSFAATSAGYFLNSGSAFTYTSIAFDGTATDTGTISACFGTNGSVLNAARNAGPGLNPLADGYHYATLIGYVSGGTGTWGGGDSNTPTCAIHAMLHR